MCKCLSKPDYHREDCPEFDVYGNKKFDKVIITTEVVFTEKDIADLRRVHMESFNRGLKIRPLPDGPTMIDDDGGITVTERNQKPK